MEENKELKRVVSMYKITCRELKLKVGQTMGEIMVKR